MEESQNKVTIDWVTQYQAEMTGNLYGYRIHNETLFRYVSQRPDVEITKDSKNALIIATPEFYAKKLEGKTNILFTMFEGLTFPKVYKENVNRADFIITPSNWVKELFEKNFPQKVFVVPHGIIPDFTFYQRKNHPKIFRFLWVGAPNPRKGYLEIIHIWDRIGFKNDPTCELYIKTTGVPNMTIEKRANVILDSRNLSKRDLVSLYHSSHCFLFPTHGEGFGLTLAEAMATGLPCIATNFSGHTDFFDKSVGFPVEYNLIESQMHSAIHKDLGTTTVAQPSVERIVELMFWMRFNYKKALAKGYAASRRIKNHYTWEKSAEKLVDVIREVN